MQECINEHVYSLAQIKKGIVMSLELRCWNPDVGVAPFGYNRVVLNYGVVSCLKSN